jgi:probable F420-dependent oxidoreductase
VKFGLMYAGAGPWATAEGARALAETAEQLGFDSLWTADHAIVVADKFDDTYRAKGGSWEFSSEYPIMDPMVWLGFAAAVTTRITLATGVLIAPIRPAVILAKQASSLSVLSGGRMMLGLGAGWLPEELAACGVQFDQRMAMLEEGIEVMRALWSGPAASFDGSFTSFERMTLSPRPAAGSVPIVLGGRVQAAAERAGRLGDGFFPHTKDLGRLESLIGTVRSAAELVGRDPDSIEIIAGGAKSPVDLVKLARLGVTHAVFSPRAQSVSALPDQLERYLKDVIDPYRNHQS